MNPRINHSLIIVRNDGELLFPVQQKNEDTGLVAFRAYPKGNTKKNFIETKDPDEITRLWVEGMGIRTTSLDGKRQGIVKQSGHSIVNYEIIN